MTRDIVLEECPYCGATSVPVKRESDIIVADCGCMLSELTIRRLTGADKREVAQL